MAKNILVTTVVSIAYLLLSAFLIGFKPEQVFLVGLFNLLYHASAPSRKFITGFSIFIVFWIVFDVRVLVVLVDAVSTTGAAPICNVNPAIKDDLGLRASAGVSVFWKSPLGPIRLDFSKVLKKDDYDRTETFRFSTTTRF